MKNKLLLLLSLYLVLTSFKGGEVSTDNRFQLPAGVTKNDYAPDVIIIKVKPEFRSLCSLTGIEETRIQKIFGEMSPAAVSKKFPDL